MSDDPSKEFQEFTSLVDRLLKVPKARLHEKMAHHRAKVRARTDPTRPGRKPKEKPEEPVKAKTRKRR
jgi:hypothetical protein